jgi:hypothetical protein
VLVVVGTSCLPKIQVCVSHLPPLHMRVSWVVSPCSSSADEVFLPFVLVILSMITCHQLLNESCPLQAAHCLVQDKWIYISLFSVFTSTSCSGLLSLGRVPLTLYIIRTEQLTHTLFVSGSRFW